MKTLLEKAKETEVGRGKKSLYSKEEVELAMAWATGELQLKQIKSVLGKGHSFNIYTFIALALRQHLTKIT